MRFITPSHYSPSRSRSIALELSRILTGVCEQSRDFTLKGKVIHILVGMYDLEQEYVRHPDLLDGVVDDIFERSNEIYLYARYGETIADIIVKIVEFLKLPDIVNRDHFVEDVLSRA